MGFDLPILTNLKIFKGDGTRIASMGVVSNHYIADTRAAVQEFD